MTAELAHSGQAVEGVHITEDIRITKDVSAIEHDGTPRDGDPHRAYAQWVSIEITNYGFRPIQVKGVYVSWGKLYINGDKDAEVPPSHFENRIINPNGSLTIASCGRAHSPSGTEGGFNLVDPGRNDAIIRSIYWSVPWGSWTNTWRITGSLAGWDVFDRGANLNSGALGNITVETVFRG